MKKILYSILLLFCTSYTLFFSWSGLASNQAVSFDNAIDAVNTGVLSAKTTITSSSKEMTKAEANTYLNINTSYAPYAAKTSSQLVIKSDLQPSTSIIATNFAASTLTGSPVASSVLACSSSLFSLINTRIYTPGGVMPDVGVHCTDNVSDLAVGWWRLTVWSPTGEVTPKRAIHITTGGIVDTVTIC